MELRRGRRVAVICRTYGAYRVHYRKPRACGRVCSNDVKAIPRLSKAGMSSRSEGWGGAEREPDRAKRNIQTVQRRTVPINKERFASIYKVASQL
jgi:hypothetical protein